MTTADVPALMDKTRDQMLEALKSISQQSSTGTESSTTPLLSDQSTNGDYQSQENTSETAAAAVNVIGEEVESKISSAAAEVEGKSGKKGKKGKLTIA